MESSDWGSNRLVTTGLWVIAEKVIGLRNSSAPSVIITSSSAPA